MGERRPDDCHPYWAGPVGRANLEGDWEWLADWVCRRFGVFVTADWVYLHRPQLRKPGWSDGSWAMWYKTQLINEGRLGHGVDGAEPPPVGRLLVEMHCFFLCVEETPEHLARLRRCRDDDDDGRGRRGVQTPAIERTQTAPRPINRTAAKVVGLNTEPRES